MNYARLKNTWNGSVSYGHQTKKTIKECYTPPVTMSYQDWIKYISTGNNILLGSGGIISSGTMQTAGGQSGAVYKGKVKQNRYAVPRSKKDYCGIF